MGNTPEIRGGIMSFTDTRKVVKTTARFTLVTSLMLRSGLTGKYSDSTIERTPDDRLHINGYVWASLLRRAMSRIAGAEMVSGQIGKFDKDAMTVSPLWCESSFIESPRTSVRSGNRISRRWGSVKPQALFSDEMVAPGHELTLAFNWFVKTIGGRNEGSDPGRIIENIQGALWVIHQGIETIGGGWSYGHGRLELTGLTIDTLDLRIDEDRRRLWQFDDAPRLVEAVQVDSWQPEIRADRAWTRIRTKARVMAGQLLAISTSVPPLDVGIVPAAKLPDTFVFRAPPAILPDGVIHQPVMITGKAVRQALLTVPVERELASLEKREDEARAKVDDWFGSMDHRGLVSVADASVNQPETVVLNRIQLCEHSMQNNNLFAGEYLCRGDFKTDVLVEAGDEAGRNLLIKIMDLVAEMMPEGNAPPGWHRLGHTSTCTGQLEITGIDETRFGGLP